MRSLSAAALLLPFAALACSAQGTEPTGGQPNGPTDSGAEVIDTSVDDGGFNTDAPPLDAPPEVVAKVYANTDDTLYEMDPLTKTVTKIGTFVGLDAAKNEDMTDIAVDQDGKIFGVSVATDGGHIYEITLPSSGTGPVSITSKRSLSSAVRFYALTFAPKGVLGTNEVLVAGDDAGTIWLVPTDGATPSKIGDFGTVKAGDPGTGKVGDVWQLSGDIVFFANGGSPLGLATVRSCAGTSCKTDSDVVIEIDIEALKAKSPSSLLRKRFIGNGTGQGRLFGVGAWNDEVFGFQRSSGTSPAQLVAISLATGTGSVVRDFPEITSAKNGWSGAGVTTAAKISLPK